MNLLVELHWVLRDWRVAVMELRAERMKTKLQQKWFHSVEQVQVKHFGKLMRQTHEDLSVKTQAKNTPAKLDRATEFVCDSAIIDLQPMLGFQNSTWHDDECIRLFRAWKCLSP